MQKLFHYFEHSKSTKCGNQESTKDPSTNPVLGQHPLSKDASNSKTFTWNSDFLFMVHHPWSHKAQPRHSHISFSASPKNKRLFWYHFVSHCPSPLPKLLPQNIHINSSTPSSQHHLYFLPFCFESSQISLGIASLRVLLTPKHQKQGQEN